MAIWNHFRYATLNGHNCETGLFTPSTPEESYQVLNSLLIAKSGRDLPTGHRKGELLSRSPFNVQSFEPRDPHSQVRLN